MKILSEESQKRYNIINLQRKQREHRGKKSQNIMILKSDKNLEKELYFSDKIRKITFFHLYFQTIHIKKQLSYVNFQSQSSELQNEEIPLEYWERIDEINQPNQTNQTNQTNTFKLINTSANLTNSIFIFNYDEWFDKFDNKKQLLANMFNLCFFILDALQILQHNDILLFNFSKLNLCFNQFERPFICKFNQCIEKSYLKTNVAIELCNENILNDPIEVFIIDFLKKNAHIHSLSNNQIELIVKKYIDNHSIIANVTVHIKEKYYHDSINYLQVLKNKPIKQTLDFLLNHTDTWDNYGFHMFFLREFLLNNTKTITYLSDDSRVFWKGFIDMFMKYILCNPNERHNIRETKYQILDYLNTNLRYLCI